MFKIGSMVKFQGKACEVIARIKVSGRYVYTIKIGNARPIPLVPERSLSK